MKKVSYLMFFPWTFHRQLRLVSDMGSGFMGRLLLLARYVVLWTRTVFILDQCILLCSFMLCAYFQVMAVDMSYRLGWIDDSLVKRVLKILQLAKLPTAPPETMTVGMFKSVMAVREY